ncbi:hypothetical protein AURDEDRAFT_69927 [Auricularia subglabra TFB-10046 SS5]|nr:hypothetical protein AURDEDRAFT_69927 [Auricularia subglabra TFB-10046 SS5]
MRLFVLALLALGAAASPSLWQAPASQNIHFNCDVSNVKPWLPTGQTNITVPTDAKPRFIVVGLGTQNYTCSDKGSYAGAVASLYDVSCLATTPIFPSIQDILFTRTDTSSAQSVIDVLLLDAVLKLGDHFFKASNQGIEPVFDFTHALKNDREFVTCKKTGGLPSPDSLGDVDWLELQNVDGDLAKYVFRLKTKAGQPPASCTAGSPPITVPYAAQYCAYGLTWSSM